MTPSVQSFIFLHPARAFFSLCSLQEVTIPLLYAPTSFSFSHHTPLLYSLRLNTNLKERDILDHSLCVLFSTYSSSIFSFSLLCEKLHCFLELKEDNMGSPSELSLDYKPSVNYPMIEKPVGYGDQPELTQKIGDFLARLEEERLKIEAFKRELPLCMQLLNNAMETYKRQLETYQANPGPRPLLEEFIPLINMTINDPDKGPSAAAQLSEKANWMVSAQLWGGQQPTSATQEPGKRPFVDMTTMLALDTTTATNTKPVCTPGAFLPFSKEKVNRGTVGPALRSRGLPELVLGSPGEKEVVEAEKRGIGGEVEYGSGKRAESGNNSGGGNNNNNSNGKGCNSNTTGGGGGGGDQGQNGHRKARRCWSPDLHRRFVNALQMLGGSQVATPKQIRELMKVDGLTNDEVKSHLQKYRLHTRRPLHPPQPLSATAPPQLVVLGGMWVPPEYATAAAAAGGPTIYSAHPAASTHYSVPHDFYTSHHHLLQYHSPTTATIACNPRLNSPPDSELRSSGDQSESMDEGEEGEDREAEEDEDEDEDEDDEGQD